MTIEYRTTMGAAQVTDGVLNGMVTPFSTETVIGDLKRGGFKEEIAPGAFSKTLQERAVVLIHNHDTAMPMARTSVAEGQEGHLSLTQGPDGFSASWLPVDTSYARDVRACAKAGILGMSFGFEVTKDDWYDSEGRSSNPQAGTKRVIREVRLHEASTTAFPAYGSTMGTVTARDAISAARGVAEARDDNKPYGDVAYADEKNGKYPVDTKEHAKAAWAYVNMPKNAEEYPLNGVTLASVKAKIKAALAKFGVEITEENSRILALEWRESMTPDGQESHEGHGDCLASIDAALDEACNQFAKCDRNALPAEINQAIDLVHGASAIATKCLKESGHPDPDMPNGNDYQEAGSATSDDEDERASDFTLIDRAYADMSAL